MDSNQSVRKTQMPPGGRKLGSFSEIVSATRRSMRVGQKDTGHIYFLASAEGPFKIGYSDHVHPRLRAPRNSSPVALQLLALVPGTAENERRYHRRFAGARLHSEWFGGSAELLAEIEDLCGRVRAAKDLQSSA